MALSLYQHIPLIDLLTNLRSCRHCQFEVNHSGSNVLWNCINMRMDYISTSTEFSNHYETMWVRGTTGWAGKQLLIALSVNLNTRKNATCSLCIAIENSKQFSPTLSTPLLPANSIFPLFLLCPAVVEEDTCRFSGVEVFHVPVNDADSHAGELRKYFESVAEKIREYVCVCGYMCLCVRETGRGE